MTKQEKDRIAKNKDLVERMKKGESLALIDQKATFWPPGRIIKKDPKALKELYGDG